jgi:hypothetical protein
MTCHRGYSGKISVLCTYIDTSGRELSVVVLVKSSAALLSKILSVHHTLKQHRWAILGIRGTLVERLLNEEASIKTDTIFQ